MLSSEFRQNLQFPSSHESSRKRRRFNLKRNRKFIVDSVLRISQNSLILCIEMLSVLRQLRSLRIDKVDKSENFLARPLATISENISLRSLRSSIHAPVL